MARKCTNFLATWMDWTDPLPCPALFRYWAGLGVISSSLSRRVWLRNYDPIPDLYPNLYILLVGPPGSGKDMAIRAATKVISIANKTSQATHVAWMGGKSLSAKGLLDRLSGEDARQSVIITDEAIPQTIHFHSLSIMLGELGTFLPEYDPRLVSIICDLYNCDDEYTETIRGGTAVTTIENPHIMMLLGTQPSTLAKVIPEDAFEMGLPARLNFIHCATNPKRSIRGNARPKSLDAALFDSLIHDVHEMRKMAGEFTTTPTVDELINDFHLTNGGQTNVPGNRFKDYNERRSLHVQKIAMCVSAAASSTKEITAEHWVDAVQALLQAERDMPLIFSQISSGKGFIREFDDIIQLSGEAAVITHADLVMKLARTRAPYEIAPIIGHGVDTGFLKPIPGQVPKTYTVDLSFGGRPAKSPLPRLLRN